MRASTISSIRQNWFTLIYGAWLWIPAVIAGLGIRPSWGSPRWVAGAVAYLAVGVWLGVLIIYRHSVPRVRVSDLTIARASAHAESIPDRLDRYRMRLRWARADGFFNVALPSVVFVFLASALVIGVSLLVVTGGWFGATFVALPFALVVAGVEFVIMRASGPRRVQWLVERMGSVVAHSPGDEALASDVESARIATGGSSAPRIAVLESSAYNAFAVGHDAESGVIVVTCALARLLDAEQREALITELTLSLRDGASVLPGEDTRHARELLLDLETVTVTCEPSGVLNLLRTLGDRETTDSAWYAGGNSLGLGDARSALIWPFVDLDDRNRQIPNRILSLDEALRAQGYYVDASAG
jgi:Zn-dependent protease with chaperone function